MTDTFFSLKTNGLSRPKFKGFFKKIPTGIGYKVIYNGEDEPPKLNKWLRADYFQKNWISEPSKIGSYKGDTYWPGFHIWLDIESAEEYASARFGCKIYKVEYRHVTAFGTNETGRVVKERMMVRNCVIAHEMRILARTCSVDEPDSKEGTEEKVNCPTGENIKQPQKQTDD